jgi:SIS domain
MEGALKLKEVSYLHAEAYPASKLKHGPLALIAPETPTVVMLPRDVLFPKNLSTIEEIWARRGLVIAITHPGELPVTVEAAFEVPSTAPELDPLLLNIPLQLLAYHVALKKGCDIDAAQSGEIRNGGIRELLPLGRLDSTADEMTKWGLMPFISTCLCSFELGLEKPDRRSSNWRWIGRAVLRPRRCLSVTGSITISALPGYSAGKQSVSRKATRGFSRRGMVWTRLISPSQV